VGVADARFPAAVEAAAYFTVAEALTNAARHAAARHVEIEVVKLRDHLRVEIRDDGSGGAEMNGGTGMRGLTDRLAALDGRLYVSSPPGEGTVLRAEIPCAS
jgi:signal transduction histidine kinase